MRPLRLFWFFLWRMVAWMISCGMVVGVLIAVLVEITGYAGGGGGEIIGARGRGLLIGGIFGVLPGVLCGLGPWVLTLIFRRLPESISTFRVVAVATCAGVLLVPAGLLAIFGNDYRGVGAMLFIPTYFEIFGIPLIFSVPFAAWGHRRRRRRFRAGRMRGRNRLVRIAL